MYVYQPILVSVMWPCLLISSSSGTVLGHSLGYLGPEMSFPWFMYFEPIPGYALFRPRTNNWNDNSFCKYFLLDILEVQRRTWAARPVVANVVSYPQSKCEQCTWRRWGHLQGSVRDWRLAASDPCLGTSSVSSSDLQLQYRESSSFHYGQFYSVLHGILTKLCFKKMENLDDFQPINFLIGVYYYIDIVVLLCIMYFKSSNLLLKSFHLP